MMQSPWGDQTDGINLHQIRKNSKLLIEHNYVNHVAEGIDSFAANLAICDNTVGGRECGIKLIHGARDTVIRRNVVVGKMSIAGIYICHPRNKNEAGQLNPDDQVRNIEISENIFDMRYTQNPGVLSEPHPQYPPDNIKVEHNRFLQDAPQAPTVTGPGCALIDNDKLLEGVEAL
jgi:hypothetical protein